MSEPNRTLQLSHALPRMTTEARLRVEEALAAGCGCRPQIQGGTKTATLTRRMIKHAVVVHIQCDNCGRSVHGAIKREGHFNWQDYQLWNQELVDKQREKWQEQAQQYTDQYKRWREQAERQRRAQYAEFLLTPAWATLRDKVITRAGGVREACGEQPATTAHHLHYRCGHAPPLWLLKAVCRPCHERLHADKRGFVDDWCPGSKPATN